METGRPIPEGKSHPIYDIIAMQFAEYMVDEGFIRMPNGKWGNEVLVGYTTEDLYNRFLIKFKGQ